MDLVFGPSAHYCPCNGGVHCVFQEVVQVTRSAKGTGAGARDPPESLARNQHVHVESMKTLYTGVYLADTCPC